MLLEGGGKPPTINTVSLEGIDNFCVLLYYPVFIKYIRTNQGNQFFLADKAGPCE